MYALNYEGLKKRETYEEIIDYIQNKQEKITYPDRFAKQIRETPQLSNLLDGNGDSIENVNDQQNDKTIIAMRDLFIKKLAMENNQTEKVLKVDSQTTAVPENFDIFTEDGGDSAGDIVEAYDNGKEEQEKTKNEKDSKTRGVVMSALKTTGQIGGDILHLAARATIGAAQGTYAVASGVASSSLFGGDDDTSVEDDQSEETKGVPDLPNADLSGKTVGELRPMLRSMDYTSIGITSKQIKGLGEGALKKNGLIEAIKQLRG